MLGWGGAHVARVGGVRETRYARFGDRWRRRATRAWRVQGRRYRGGALRARLHTCLREARYARLSASLARADAQGLSTFPLRTQGLCSLHRGSPAGCHGRARGLRRGSGLCAGALRKGSAQGLCARALRRGSTQGPFLVHLCKPQYSLRGYSLQPRYPLHGYSLRSRRCPLWFIYLIPPPRYARSKKLHRHRAHRRATRGPGQSSCTPALRADRYVAPPRYARSTSD